MTSSSVPHLGCCIPALPFSFLTPHALTGSTLKIIIKAVLRTSFFMHNICQKRCNFGLSIKQLFRRGKYSECRFTRCKHAFVTWLIWSSCVDSYWLTLITSKSWWNFIPLLRWWVYLSILFSDKLCIICKYSSYLWRIMLKVWHYQRTVEYSVLLTYPRKDW